MTSIRPLLCALAACLIAGAAADTAVAGPLTDQVNELRGAAGLPAVTATSAEGPEAAASALESAGDDGDQEAGRGVVVVPTGMPARRLFALHPSAIALVLDPRAVAIDEATAGLATALAVTVDTAQRWDAPVPTRTAVDPARQELGFVLPPSRSGAFLRLQAFDHGRWRKIGSVVDLMEGEPAPTGAVFAALRSFDMRRWLPFGARIRLVAGRGVSAEVRTAALSPAARRRSFRFGTAAARDRRALRAAVRAGNPRARRIAAVLDGFTAVDVPAHIDGHPAITERQPDGTYRISIRRAVVRGPAGVRNEIVWHEIGHVAEMGGLDRRTSRALARLVPTGGRCRPELLASASGPCSPTTERLADTFAKWALGRRTLRSGYHVPAPRSLSRYGRILVRGFDFRLAGPPEGYDHW